MTKQPELQAKAPLERPPELNQEALRESKGWLKTIWDSKIVRLMVYAGLAAGALLAGQKTGAFDKMKFDVKSDQGLAALHPENLAKQSWNKGMDRLNTGGEFVSERLWDALPNVSGKKD